MEARHHLSQPGVGSNYFSSLIEISASVIVPQKYKAGPETLCLAKAEWGWEWGGELPLLRPVDNIMPPEPVLGRPLP